MLEKVIKYNGEIEDFDPNKINKWAKYAAKEGGDWSEIALETFKRLPKVSSSEDIHQTMINVCYSKEDIHYSRIAARLEVAQLRKNMDRKLGLKPNIDSFKTIREVFINNGLWCGDTLPSYSQEQEDLYQEIKTERLEAWQISQWADKYLKKIGDSVVETPQLAAMGIGLGLLGDNKEGHSLTRNIIKSKVNLPTPVLNGIRDGDFDGVSCCVISAGDTVESIAVAEHVALMMTAKKAGIGIEYTTRSKGSPVKGGMVEHLGKHSIYKSLDGAVKLFTQQTRGGSATVTFNVIDPEVKNIALWKSQRIDIDQRLDRLDYSFAFNDAFLDSVKNGKPWYLFDYQESPSVWEAFYTASVEDYYSAVEAELARGANHTLLNAMELLKHLLIIRQEVGRLYCFNVSRANEHTPFVDTIKLSNLCQEIALPTTPYGGMLDLYVGSEGSVGETAFCSLAALVPLHITDEEYEDVAYNTVLAVSTLIERCPKLTANHEKTMLERMSLGIGVTGLAEVLYNEGLDYDGSDKSLEFVHDLFEKHYFHLLKASTRLAKDTGKSVGGITNWLPVDTKRSKWRSKQDWESLRGLPRYNSVLAALMPTESSSLASGVTNSVYPPRTKIINKKSRKGIVQFICPTFIEGKNITAWDVDNITMSRYYGVMQDWVDQGISADQFFKPANYENKRKPLSELVREFFAHFAFGNKSMYYLNTFDNNGGGVHDVFLEEVEEEECSTCTL